MDERSAPSEPLQPTRRVLIHRGAIGGGAAAALALTALIEAAPAQATSYAILGTDGTVGGPSGSPLNASVLNASQLFPSGGDDTSAITAAFTARGSVYLGPGSFQVNSTLAVPIGANLIGAGAGQTTLLLGSSGELQHGTTTAPATVTGGITQGLEIHGNGSTSHGLYIGLCVGRLFVDLIVTDCASDACLLETSQNNTFINCQFGGSGTAGNALALDLGAGGNRFINCEISGFGKYGVEFRQTASDGGLLEYSTINGPSDNVFIGCRVENAGTGSPGLVHHAAGTFNQFIAGCGLAVASTSTPAVLMSTSTVGSTTVKSLGLTFANSRILGPVSGSTGCALSLTGNCSAIVSCGSIGGFANAYVTTHYDSVQRTDVALGLSGAEWVQASGDTPSVPSTTVLSGQDPTAWTALTYATGWSNAMGGNAPGGFRRRSNRIELRGMTSVGTGAATAIATGLPAPPHVLTFVTGGGFVVQINGSGQLTTNAYEGGSGTLVELDATGYDLDQ